MSRLFDWLRLITRLRQENKKLHKQVKELKKDKLRLGVEITHLYQKNLEIEQKLQDCIGGLP